MTKTAETLTQSIEAKAQPVLDLAQRLYAEIEADHARGRKLEVADLTDGEYRDTLIFLVRVQGQTEHQGGFDIGRMIKHCPYLDAMIDLAHVAAEEFQHGQYYYQVLAELGIDTQALADEVNAVELTGDESRVRWLPHVKPSVWASWFGSWEGCVIFGVLFDPIALIHVGRYAVSNYGPLARRAKAIVEEELGHVGFGLKWLPVLLAEPNGRERAQAAIDRLWPMAYGLVGDPNTPLNQRLTRLGLQNWDVDAWREEYKRALEQVLGAYGLTVPDSTPRYIGLKRY